MRSITGVRKISPGPCGRSAGRGEDHAALVLAQHADEAASRITAKKTAMAMIASCCHAGLSPVCGRPRGVTFSVSPSTESTGRSPRVQAPHRHRPASRATERPHEEAIGSSGTALRVQPVEHGPCLAGDRLRHAEHRQAAQQRAAATITTTSIEKTVAVLNRGSPLSLIRGGDAAHREHRVAPSSTRGCNKTIATTNSRTPLRSRAALRRRSEQRDRDTPGSHGCGAEELENATPAEALL